MKKRRTRQALPALLISALMYSSSAGADAGLYSEAQAARGERLYESYCSTCHGAKLEGKTAVPLNGAAFASRWADDEHSIDDLLYIVRTQMPYSDPGKLSKQEYLDIVTFILKVNGYPGGSEDLPLDAKKLGGIKLKR